MRALILLLCIVALSSCKSLTPFTQDLYADLDMSEEELKHVQFYLSKDIILYRALSASEAEVTKGKIKLKKGQKVQEIVIRQGTPGVLMFMPKEDRFAISFESENDDFLMFGPNKKLSQKYTLLGKSWEGRIGEVTYGDQVYQTSTKNALAALMVDLSKFKNTKITRKTAGGRKVSE